MVTDELKKLELKTAIALFVASLISFLIYAFLWRFNMMYLISIVFFGIGITIIFRKDEDVRLGGILTFPLLLYYSLSNALVPVHFMIMVAIGLPLTILLIRRGYIGQVLFYMSSLFMFPLTVLSYYFLIEQIPPIILASVTFDPGFVIYILLPHIYVYNLIKLPKDKILNDIIILLLLLIGSIGFWLLLNIITSV